MSRENLVPILSIQCDWDDFINRRNAEIWISCKYREERSTHGKLKAKGGGELPISDSQQFEVKALEHGYLLLKHISGHECVFVPPNKTFSNIHKKNVSSIDTTDGGLGVSVSNDNILKIWNAETGVVSKLLQGHVGDVYKCKYFPSGIVVLSGGADMQLKIWSAETGDCPVTLKGHKGPVMDFSMIERGRNIVSVAKDGTVKLWDVGQANCLATLLTLDSSVTINSCDIGYIHECIADLDNIVINQREIGTEDKIVLVGSEDGFVNGIHIFTRHVVFTIKLETSVNCVKFLNQEYFVVGCQNGAVLIYQISNTNQAHKGLHESNSPVLSICVYKNLGFFVGRNDGTVTFYLTKNNQFDNNLRLQLTGSDFDPIYGISVGSNFIYTACRDGKIRQYQIFNIINKLFS